MIDLDMVRQVEKLPLAQVIELAARQLRAETSQPDGGKRIAEIRARLEAASPGPWFRGEMQEDEYITGCSIGPFEAKDHSEDTICLVAAQEHDNEQNGDFIANAPSDIEYLLGLLK